MSRIGRKPVEIPDKVQVSMKEGVVFVEGPNGKLKKTIPKGIEVVISDKKIEFKRKNDERKARAFHGLARALVQNMVVGVSTGFEKKLEISGLGLKAQVVEKGLQLNLGFANPVMIDLPQAIKIKVDGGGTKLTLTSADKELLGSFTARIRSLKPPEPYKATGIKYSDEVVIKKAGKTTGAGAT